jgi:hypothetical protein
MQWKGAGIFVARAVFRVVSGAGARAGGAKLVRKKEKKTLHLPRPAVYKLTPVFFFFFFFTFTEGAS